MSPRSSPEVAKHRDVHFQADAKSARDLLYCDWVMRIGNPSSAPVKICFPTDFVNVFCELKL